MDNKPAITQPQESTKDILQPTLVWDLPLRLFHWAMVCVVFIAGVTGFLAPEWWLDIHVFAGFALGILLTFRIIWGFMGSQFSKFRNFSLSPAAVLQHLRAIRRNMQTEHLGHNPVGAWMIVILILVLSLLVLTGLLVSGGQENLGPLASVITFQVGAIAGNAHEIAAWVLVAAIVIHLLGVFVETQIFQHPVLKAMITGRKMTAHPLKIPAGRHTTKGGVLFLTICALLIGGGMFLTSFPPFGWQEIHVMGPYAEECGECHHAYHPGLRSGEAWNTLMLNLPDHYGEDASLDEDLTESIKAYLIENAAKTFDTEASRRIGLVETTSLRMTDTRYWKRRHKDIAQTVFRQSNIGSKINCNACHKDAASGRFDDTRIHIPEGIKK